MAEEEQNKKQEEKKQQDSGEKGIGITGICLIAAVLVFAIAGGFFTGKIMGSDSSGDSNGASEPGAKEQTQQKTNEEQQKGKNKNSVESWYYDLDPVLANLNVPGATRYVRAVLTLEMSGELSREEGRKLFKKKKPVLINWLTIYLSSLGLEEVKGDENLRRIQTTIGDVFNEKLWPDSKPKIEQVLIKEFPIQ